MDDSRDREGGGRSREESAPRTGAPAPGTRDASPPGAPPGALARLCALDEPTRRRLYSYVVDHGEPVTRDEVSAHTGLDRSLVAYHLDRLVEAGLLEAWFHRHPGRGGPGAGRPAKHYGRARGELAVTVPPRDYRLAAEILAEAVAADAAAGSLERLERVAHRRGRRLGAANTAPDLGALLHHQGFEPYDDEGVTRLRNCPFRALAEEHRETVCRMNLAFLRGVLQESPGEGLCAELDPDDEHCCVVFVPAP